MGDHRVAFDHGKAVGEQHVSQPAGEACDGFEIDSRGAAGAGQQRRRAQLPQRSLDPPVGGGSAAPALPHPRASGKVTAIASPTAPPRPNARQRILAAAVRRIAREGIDDVRLARIAADAGVSAALVSYHFATRDALLAEALEHSYEYAATARISVPDDEPDAAAKRVAAMIDQCLPTPGALRDDWVLWVELWLRATRHPELRPTAARLYARMRDWFGEAIAAGMAGGEFAAGDAGRIADRLLALIDGYGVRALNEDPLMPLARARAEIWAAISADLGVDPSLPLPA
jgi:AcrR family transcriptional regulator